MKMSTKYEHFIVASYENKLYKHSTRDVDGFSKRWIDNPNVWPDNIFIDSGNDESEILAKLLFIGGKSL